MLTTNPSQWSEVKIATYLICKNEIEHIDNWLPLVWNGGTGSDYICILDTGSTDGTYEKLIQKAQELRIPKEQFILSQKTYDDFRFDTARNDSLQLVPKGKVDVCFCVDMDEYVNVDLWNDLRKVVFEHPDFNIINYRYEKYRDYIFWYDKIHNPDGWHWKHIIHEFLVNDNLVEPIRYALDANKLYLVHHQNKKKNRGFYLKLMKKRSEEDPTDPGIIYYIADDYLCDLKYEDAIFYFEKCILTIIQNPEKDFHMLPNCYMQIAYCLEHLSNVPIEIIDFYYNKAISEDTTFGVPYIWLAQFYVYTGRPQLARQIMEQFDKNAIKREMWDDKWYIWTEWKRCQIYGGILCWEGNYKEAYEVFKNGELSINTDNDYITAKVQGFYDDKEWCENMIKEINL